MANGIVAECEGRVSSVCLLELEECVLALNLELLLELLLMAKDCQLLDRSCCGCERSKRGDGGRSAE